MGFAVWVLLRFFAPGHPPAEEPFHCFGWVTCSMTTGVCIDDASCHNQRQSKICWSTQDTPTITYCDQGGG
jgi:hypothetical protein